MPTDIDRNRVAASNEARVLTAIRNARVPLSVSEIARVARLTRNLALVTVNQLITDGRVCPDYDDRRQLDVYRLTVTA